MPLITGTSPCSGRNFVFHLTRDKTTSEARGSHQITVNDSGAALAAGLGVLTTYAFLVPPHLQSGTLQRLFPS